GMPILKIASTSGITNITNNNSAYTKDTGITSFGKNATQSPAFYVKTDASVVSLGTYKDSYYTSFAVKDMGDWKSIFSGSVTVPAAILRAIAIDAGVHSYFPAVCGDAIETDNHFLSYLAASTGEKRIVLPSASHVVDMITGKTIGNGITSFSFNSEYAGDIRFYSITAGSAKALDITRDAVAKTFGWKDENGGIKTIVPGEQLGFTFTGTFVSINVAKGPGNGVIKVKIDGMEYPDVNLNTREGDENPNAEIVLAHGLKNEKHTVILEVNNPIDYTATSDGYDTSTPERNITHNGVEVPPNLNFSADQPYNMGIKFSVKLPGRITHARLVAGPRSNGVLHKVTLWRAADQSIVAGPFDWTFETDIAQWLEFELPEPVEIEAGVNYVMTVASVVTGNYNYYWAQGQFFPRKENSVIVTYSDSGLFSTNINAFPTLTFNSSTYGRDIVFAFDPPKEDEDEVKVLNENIQIYSANVVGEFGEPPVLDNMVDWAKGDVNLDGEVDILDIILAKKYISGGTVLSESQITEGDTQHDGVLDEIDFANNFKIIFKD
ncbi:MAG: DUF4082 domain-containing protein, partial [Clostridia bacterium]|nr:DUF4082 domain-containing protein [Clostridia bacterium]